MDTQALSPERRLDSFRAYYAAAIKAGHDSEDAELRALCGVRFESDFALRIARESVANMVTGALVWMRETDMPSGYREFRGCDASSVLLTLDWNEDMRQIDVDVFESEGTTTVELTLHADLSNCLLSVAKAIECEYPCVADLEWITTEDDRPRASFTVSRVYGKAKKVTGRSA